MRVFIRWSGDDSNQVALVLRDWLPTVLQHVETFVSSEDIDKGAVWLNSLNTELNDAGFGII